MPRNLNDSIPGAPNFKYKEFVRSDVAKRKGIDNTPEDWQWENIERLAVSVLQPIRDQFGRIRITSGFRSVELCLAIGSSATSNHTRGEAADVEPVDGDVTLTDILEWIDNNLEYRELIAEYFPDGWIHVAYRHGDNNRQLKLKDPSYDYARVRLDLIRNLYA